MVSVDVLQKLLNHTATQYKTPVEVLTGRSRKEPTAFIRQIAMYYMWINTGATLREIGEVLGDRCPATIFQGIQNISYIVDKKECYRMNCPLNRSEIYCKDCYFSKPISTKDETPLCDYPYYKNASEREIRDITARTDT